MFSVTDVNQSLGIGVELPLRLKKCYFLSSWINENYDLPMSVHVVIKEVSIAGILLK